MGPEDHTNMAAKAFVPGTHSHLCGLDSDFLLVGRVFIFKPISFKLSSDALVVTVASSSRS